MTISHHVRKGLILEWALFSDNVTYSASVNKVPLQDYQNEHPDN